MPKDVLIELRGGSRTLLLLFSLLSENPRPSPKPPPAVQGVLSPWVGVGVGSLAAVLSRAKGAAADSTAAEQEGKGNDVPPAAVRSVVVLLHAAGFGLQCSSAAAVYIVATTLCPILPSPNSPTAVFLPPRHLTPLQPRDYVFC